VTAYDIKRRLFLASKPVTLTRILKAKGLASRSKIDWSDVRDQMLQEQRDVVDALERGDA
jgi:hypothetical protein